MSREKNRRHREQPPPHPQRRQECLDSPEEPGEAVGAGQVPGKGRRGRGHVGTRRAQIRRDPTGPAEGVGGSTAPPPLGCAPLYTAQVQGPEPELGVMLRVWWGPKDTALGSPGWFGMLSPDTGPSKSLDLSGPGFLVYLKGHRVRPRARVHCDGREQPGLSHPALGCVRSSSKHLRGALIQRILTFKEKGRLERVSKSAGSTLWRRVLQGLKVASSASLPPTPASPPRPPIRAGLPLPGNHAPGWLRLLEALRGLFKQVCLSRKIKQTATLRGRHGTTAKDYPST